MFPPHLVYGMLLHHENKRFVVVGVQVGHLHAGLLLLPNPLPLGVEELYLDIRIRGSGDVHLLKLLAFQDTNCQLQMLDSEKENLFLVHLDISMLCTKIFYGILDISKIQSKHLQTE